MYLLVVILILIVSVLLGLIVLVQNSKGGGLVSNFGGTWTMAGILVVLCLISSITLPKNAKEGTPKSAIENMVSPDLQTETPAATMGGATATEAPAQSTEAPAETPAE